MDNIENGDTHNTHKTPYFPRTGTDQQLFDAEQTETYSKKHNLLILRHHVVFANKVLEIIAQKFGIPTSKIIGFGRKGIVVRARTMFIYFVASRTSLPYYHLAKFLESGDGMARDHTAIIYGLELHDDCLFRKVTEPEYWGIFPDVLEAISDMVVVPRDIPMGNRIAQEGQFLRGKIIPIGNSDAGKVLMQQRQELEKELGEFAHFLGLKDVQHKVAEYLNRKSILAQSG